MVTKIVGLLYVLVSLVDGHRAAQPGGRDHGLLHHPGTGRDFDGDGNPVAADESDRHVRGHGYWPRRVPGHALPDARPSPARKPCRWIGSWYLLTQHAEAVKIGAPLVAGILGGIVGSLLTRPPDPAVIDRFFTKIYTPIGQEDRLSQTLDKPFRRTSGGSPGADCGSSSRRVRVG
jgi:hypothetical protein